MSDMNDMNEYDETEETREVPLTTMLTGSGAEEPERRTHPLSVGYLVCGLVFLGIAASWGLRQLGVIESGGEQWVLPLVLVVAGGAGLLALVAKGMLGSRH